MACVVNDVSQLSLDIYYIWSSVIRRDNKILHFGIVLLACTILKIPSILVLRWYSCSYCCPPHS